MCPRFDESKANVCHPPMSFRYGPLAVIFFLAIYE